MRASQRAAVQWPSHPEALRSAAGYAVPPPQSLLWPHLRLSEPPADLCLRRRVFACQPAPRGSPLYSTCVCQRAAFRTPVDRAGALGCCFPTRTSLRHLYIGSASTAPRTSVPTRLCFEAAKFALCYGPSTGSPFTDKDFLRSSFHLRSHLPKMSSMTTRAHSQFPRPDLHRQHTQRCGLQTEDTENSGFWGEQLARLG